MRRPNRDGEDELRRFRARGRIEIEGRAPRLALRVPDRLMRGEAIPLQWNASAAGRTILSMLDSMGRRRILSERPRGALLLEALAAGEYTIELTAQPHRQLGVRGRSATMLATLLIQVPLPVIHLGAPARAEAGDEIVVGWRTENSDNVWLTVGDDNHIVDLNGEYRCRALQPGGLQIVITAHGEGGEVQESRAIVVSEPVLRIDAPDAVVAEIGCDAGFSYRVRGAVPGSIRLISLDRDEEPLGLPPAARIEVPQLFETERFRLEAVAHGGGRATHLVTVRAVMPTLSIENELNLTLAGRW